MRETKQNRIFKTFNVTWFCQQNQNGKIDTSFLNSFPALFSAGVNFFLVPVTVLCFGFRMRMCSYHTNLLGSMLNCVYPKSRNSSVIVPCSATEEMYKKKIKKKTKKLWGTLAGRGDLNWTTGYCTLREPCISMNRGCHLEERPVWAGKWGLAPLNRRWAIALSLTHLFGFFPFFIIIIITIIIVFYFIFNYYLVLISTYKF